ncbi:hypothetical protein FWK35_00004697, partial [Aphis craccivora]
LTSCFKKF